MQWISWQLVYFVYRWSLQLPDYYLDLGHRMYLLFFFWVSKISLANFLSTTDWTSKHYIYSRVANSFSSVYVCIQVIYLGPIGRGEEVTISRILWRIKRQLRTVPVLMIRISSSDGLVFRHFERQFAYSYFSSPFYLLLFLLKKHDKTVWFGVDNWYLGIDISLNNVTSYHTARGLNVQRNLETFKNNMDFHNNKSWSSNQLSLESCFKTILFQEFLSFTNLFKLFLIQYHRTHALVLMVVSIYRRTTTNCGVRRVAFISLWKLA